MYFLHKQPLNWSYKFWCGWFKNLHNVVECTINCIIYLLHEWDEIMNCVWILWMILDCNCCTLLCSDCDLYNKCVHKLTRTTVHRTVVSHERISRHHHRHKFITVIYVMFVWWESRRILTLTIIAVYSKKILWWLNEWKERWASYIFYLPWVCWWCRVVYGVISL